VKERRKLELDQTTAMSVLYHQKCLLPTDMKEILLHAIYKYFARKRPWEINQDDALGRLARNKKAGSSPALLALTNSTV